MTAGTPGHGHGHGAGNGHDHGDHQDIRFTPEFWDERYASKPQIWSGEPNVHFVAEAAGLTPGRALDAGCGEGADAVWLARRGWTVDATDVSRVALDRAAAHAAERAPDVAGRITWRQLDLLASAPDASAYDLVSAQFIHFPADARVRVYDALAAAVAPGGTLLVVAHHPSVMATHASRPQQPDLYFTADDVAARLDPARWEVVVADARQRVGRTPDGDEIQVEDAVLRARRHA